MYTWTALSTIYKFFKRFSLAFSIITQVGYIVYLVYALTNGVGHWFFNLPLLLVSTAFLFYYIGKHIPGSKERKRKRREKRRAKQREKHRDYTIKKSVDWFKMGIKAATLGITLYGIYIAAENISAVTVTLAAFSVVMFLISFFSEIITMVIHLLFAVIRAGVELDTEPIKAPLQKIGAVFHTDEPSEEDENELESIKEFLKKRHQKDQNQRDKTRQKRKAARKAKWTALMEGDDAPKRTRKRGKRAPEPESPAEEVSPVPRRRRGLRELFHLRRHATPDKVHEAETKSCTDTSEGNHRRRRFWR